MFESWLAAGRTALDHRAQFYQVDLFGDVVQHHHVEGAGERLHQDTAIPSCRCIRRTKAAPQLNLSSSEDPGATTLQKGVTAEASLPSRICSQAASPTMRKNIPVETGQAAATEYFAAICSRNSRGSTNWPGGMRRIN